MTTPSSLFGITPEALMAQRDALLDRQAMDFAGLTTAKQAEYGAFRAGRMLADGIGGLMGVQDPELVRLAQRQSLTRGIDWSNPESIKEAVMRASQMGDTQAALELTARFQEMKKAASQEMLQRAQAVRAITGADKDRATAKYAGYTNEMKNAAALAASKKFEPGTEEYQEEFRKQLILLTDKDKAPTYGQDVNAYSMALFNRQFEDLNPNERLQVMTKVDQEKAKRTPKTEIYLPGQGTAKVQDISNAENRVSSELKPYREAYDQVDQALNQLRLNNPKAGAQVDRLLATMAGDKQLSMAEVQAVANAGSLPQRVVDSFSKFFTGQAGALSQEQKKDVLEAYQDIVASRHNSTQKRLRDVYGTSELAKNQVEAIIGSPLKTRKGAAGGAQKTSKGTSYTIVNE